MSKERRKSLIAYSLLDGIEDGRIRYVLAILQDEDADPNYLLHDRGIAPIHMAIGHGSKAFALEVTGVLLQYGANPNVCSAEGMTPVHIASAWGRARLLRLLLSNGGNPWLEDDEGKNAFHFAFEESHAAALQVLEDFRLQDSGKFDDWPELCDPNPKFTIALDKVLLYNREVLLSYQARVPFAGCGRRSAATQTTPPASPPPEQTTPPPPPDKRVPTSRAVCPAAASTTALDRFSFVLSDIRNKVVSQVTLRKTAHRPLSRRTAQAPAPSPAPLSFLDELRQRQSLGLRHAATQMSPPERPENKLVRDEVMVRVSASPAHSGDDSRGSDQFESRLDRAFRHLEVDAAFTGEAMESLDEDELESVAIGPGLVLAEPQPPDELRLDLGCLRAIQEEPSVLDNSGESCDFHYVTSNDNLCDCNVNSSDNVFVCNVTSNGLDLASKASPSRDNIPYGIHDSSFGVSHTSFGTNFRTANASNNTSLGFGNGTSHGGNNETQDNIINRVGCDNLSATNNQTNNDASFRGQNDSLGANHALFRTSSNSSVLKSAWLGMDDPLSIDVHDQHSSNEPHDESALRDESRDMFSETSCELYEQPPLDVNSHDLAEDRGAPLNASSMSAQQSPGSVSLLMVTARSQPSISMIQAGPIQARGNGAIHNQTGTDPNHSREANASTNHTREANASTNHTSAIDSGVVSAIADRANDSDQEPCEIDASCADCQGHPRDDGCSIVWESAIDASDSFISCRGDAVLNPTETLCNGALSNGALTKGTRENDSRQHEDVVKHSFVSAAEEVSKEFISDDEECFDSEPADLECSEPLGGKYFVGNGEATTSKASQLRRSCSSASSVSASEEYVYTDEEEGVVLVERRFLVPHSDADSSGGSLPVELEGYDTDRLRAELRKHGVEPGPILPSTKKVYVKKLQRAARGRAEPDLKQMYSCELDRSLRDDTWSADLAQYEALESEMSAPFAAADPRKCWREGVLKSSFCYLLLDPRISANLPCRAAQTPPAEAWATFLEAVFYVGKGKRSRPYSHLYQAVGLWKSGGRARDAKTQQILDIWAAGLGVVCLHVFQNVIPAEAYTREAAMLDALTLGRVRNARRSEYYGVAATWPAKRRNMLGTLLLHKAMRIFFGEGERQLRPGDIKQ